MNLGELSANDWFLIALVIIAFVVGYLATTAIIEKIRPHRHTDTQAEEQAGQREQGEDGGNRE